MPSLNLSEWAVVMPSIREINLEYLAPIPEEVRIFIVDDSNGTIEPSRPNMEVFVYDDYRRVLGDEEAIIPRKSDTCRSFGFYQAWKEGYKYVITLDDDCKCHEGFMQGHSIVDQELTVKSVNPLPWFNTLDLLELKTEEPTDRRHYSRGLPYRYRSNTVPSLEEGSATGRVACNVGLWTQVPDINGLDKLGVETPTSVGLKQDCVAVGPGSMFSLTIMNVAILAEALPAFYQLPMGVNVCDTQLDRFGDIWSGYILKKLTDIRGDLVTTGQPLVTHTKAGNTIRETQVEHYGHLMEGDFYELVDRAADEVDAGSYEDKYYQFAENFVLATSRRALPDAYREFFNEMGGKMIRWSKLFQQAPVHEVAPARSAVAPVG